MTRSTTDVMADVDATLVRLAEGTRELFWDWDQRFDTAVGRVSDPEHLPVLSLLDDCFAQRWDHQDIGEASSAAQEIAAGWGGLRPGQLLYTSTESPLLFAAWWPWGSGTTFSLRVGCRISTAEAQQEMAKRLRSLFGA